ncbi:MAG: SDR family oxidoreductase [Dehalococcoidia bacterium]
MPNTLVTGGAGFIGSHLVERLLANGHLVRVLDNYSTGRKSNLDHLTHHPKLTVVETDIAGPEPLDPHFEGVDWVFHLAALADIVPSIQRPVEYHRANVDGTLAVVEAARHAGVSRFLYSASSSCYGIPDDYPTPETAEIRPQYPYALTKYLGEQIALHWHHVYKLPVVSLRLFNVYGPRSRTSGTYGAVFGVFLAQKLAGKPYTRVGDGSQRRDFTYVTDVVEAFVQAAESSLAGKVMNVGTGRPQSVNHLIDLLGGDVIEIPKRPGEPEITQADVSRIERELGWRARTSFEDGVQLLLEHIDYWRAAPVWEPDTIARATEEWFSYLGDERSGAALGEGRRG